MAMGRRSWRAVAMAACLPWVLVAALTGCDSGTADNAATNDDSASNSETTPGTVAIFTPDNALSISSKVPLNTWAKFTASLHGVLVKQGVDKHDIESVTSSTMAEQSQDVQDYVVDHVNDQSADEQRRSSSKDAQSSVAPTAGADTLIVAPVTNTRDVTRQYGDYVTQPTTENVATVTDDDAANANSSSNGGDAATSTDTNSAATETNTHVSDESRLVSALQLAKDHGMHVIVVANPISGFTPDAFVSMSTAREIGRVQAQQLVGKLQLDTASTDNPKRIEILLPCSPQTHDDTSNDEADAQEPSDASAAFAQEAFAGAWEILKPYFQSGQAMSPSGLLNADTATDDWRSVAFAATSSDDVRNEVSKRLPLSEANTHTRIDGIIAMNDETAAYVIDELHDLGYTGSAADVNPSISIADIVSNIAGNKDLSRKPVPDPIKEPQSHDEADEDSKAIEQINSRWPIVTGYGAYASQMPSIVNGAQWMTACENRDQLAHDTAIVAVKLSMQQPINTLSYVASTTVNGNKVPTIAEGLLAVSAGNLKETLIDPGYITLAQAGL